MVCQVFHYLYSAAPGITMKRLTVDHHKAHNTLGSRWNAMAMVFFIVSMMPSVVYKSLQCAPIVH